MMRKYHQKLAELVETGRCYLFTISVLFVLETLDFTDMTYDEVSHLCCNLL